MNHKKAIRYSWDSLRSATNVERPSGENLGNELARELSPAQLLSDPHNIL